jgi:hypothetical protein
MSLGFKTLRLHLTSRGGSLGGDSCRLTLHSSGPPTACRAVQSALGLRPILRRLASAPSRRGPLNSNVRPHMYTCPECRLQGIRTLAKWWSWPAAPAKCRHCNSLFTSPVRESGIHTVIAAIAITLSGFASIALHSAWPVWLTICACFAAFGVKWHQQSLLPLSPAQVSAWRRAEGAGVVLLALSFLFQ